MYVYTMYCYLALTFCALGHNFYVNPFSSHAADVFHPFAYMMYNVQCTLYITHPPSFTLSLYTSVLSSWFSYVEVPEVMFTYMYMYSVCICICTLSLCFYRRTATRLMIVLIGVSTLTSVFEREEGVLYRSTHMCYSTCMYNLDTLGIEQSVLISEVS